ncbi:hypothetical protein LINGRAHAP2_LOCUS15390 [Linum grandiflorum]
MRVLKNNGAGDHGAGLLLQSLQKGPVSGSAPNPCTNIPGRNPGTCTVSAMNVAGNALARPPPLVSRLAAAKESGQSS